MRKTKSLSGFTLLEVVLAMAILGIILIALLTLYTSGFKSIVHAGKSGDELYNTQSSLETKIYQGAAVDSAAEIEIELPEPLESPYPTSVIIVDGEFVEEDGIKIFLPER
jgi:prepilin-type N-terminal cleavage/methylation domain-containing protein